MPKTPYLTLSQIEDLKRQGFTQSEIGEMFNLTRQAISWIKCTYGGSLTPREQMRGKFPWAITGDFKKAAPSQRLRDHAEFMATGGKGMPEYKLKNLRGFYKKLRDKNVVVEYDPSIPPSPGIKPGGWAYRERVPTDEDLIIRVNEYSTLSDDDKWIWEFPPEEP